MSVHLHCPREPVGQSLHVRSASKASQAGESSCCRTSPCSSSRPSAWAANRAEHDWISTDSGVAPSHRLARFLILAESVCTIAVK